MATIDDLTTEEYMDYCARMGAHWNGKVRAMAKIINESNNMTQDNPGSDSGIDADNAVVVRRRNARLQSKRSEAPESVDTYIANNRSR